MCPCPTPLCCHIITTSKGFSIQDTGVLSVFALCFLRIMSDTPRIVIGDLGISKTVYANDYYAVSATVTLPVRWMAPELLLNTAQYSIKTDVVR